MECGGALLQCSGSWGLHETLSQQKEGRGRQRQTERHTETKRYLERDWDIKVTQLHQLLIDWLLTLGHFLSELLLHFSIHVFDAWARIPQTPGVAKNIDHGACSCLRHVSGSFSHHCSPWEAELLHSGSGLQLRKSQWRRQEHHAALTAEVK